MREAFVLEMGQLKAVCKVKCPQHFLFLLNLGSYNIPLGFRSSICRSFRSKVFWCWYLNTLGLDSSFWEREHKTQVTVPSVKWIIGSPLKSLTAKSCLPPHHLPAPDPGMEVSSEPTCWHRTYPHCSPAFMRAFSWSACGRQERSLDMNTQRRGSITESIHPPPRSTRTRWTRRDFAQC